MLPQSWTDENDGKPSFMTAKLVHQLARATLLLVQFDPFLKLILDLSPGKPAEGSSLSQIAYRRSLFPSFLGAARERSDERYRKCCGGQSSRFESIAIRFW